MTALLFSLTKGQKYTLVVTPQDDTGAPASLVSKPVWSVSDPAVFGLAAASDGLSCIATSLKAGAAAIHANAVGVGPLDAEADGTVTTPLATRLVMTGQAS